jgi:hydrogenase-4 component F
MNLESLIILAALPALSMGCCLLPSVKLAGRLMSGLLWIQTLALAYLVWPLFDGTQQQLTLADGFLLDKTAGGFVILTGLVVAASLTQAQLFFQRELSSEDPPSADHVKLFYLLFVLFLLSAIFVYCCDNLGFMWIGIEATTLVSAGLVYFNRTKNALEATWKYFIICSVGIAFALLGTILVFASSQHGATPDGSLYISRLIEVAPQLDVTLCKLGFIFCLLGYGTKAGVFPLHSWLPDAHSEAPAPGSALLSGALLNCSLFAIWKISEVLENCQLKALSDNVVLCMGAVTAVAASLFLVRQHGLKRLWAYSSIENVGIMLVAIGFGSGALFLLQAINHSLCKVALFLISGNIVQATGTKEISEIRGVVSFAPMWAIVLGLGAIAATGVPPFGTFLSEWLILTKGFEVHQIAAVVAVVVALTLSFIAVCYHIGRVLFGTPRPEWIAQKPIMSALIPCALLLGSVVLGVMLPPALSR